MCNRHIFITILGAVFLWTCNAAPLNSNEVEAEQFVQQISEKLYNHYNKLSRDTFNIQDKDPATVLDEYYTIMQTANALIAIVNDSKAYDCTQFKDEQLKYIFQKIRRSAEEAAVGEKTYLTMITFLTALDELSTNRDIQAYRNNSVKLAYFPDIQNIFAENNDPEELKYYWTAWRRKTNMWAAYNFYIIGSSLKDAANMTEIPPLEFWLREYNVTEMEQVMTQIQPLYRQLHAFIRNQLHKKYGDSVIKSNGPIPDHLFQQVLAQSWTNGSVIDEMYPHKDLPPYDSILEKNNYDTLKLFKTADKFYQSLGFDPIPDDLWTSQIKMNKDEDKGDCRATIFDLTPNVYMRYCHKMNFRKFLQAHGYMGRLYYAREKTNLPAYYFSSHNLEYPVGEAVILSASTPKHLNAIEIVTDFEFTEEVRMNRLLRMGIHTLLNVPVYFVHTKVMADLFAETVEFTELNRHYWMLMEKYVGVEPPVDRASDSLDFPFKFYIDLNKNKQAIKFNSEILGYQFYKKLCEISGQYPQEPLQYCDFYGSKMVGSALKASMCNRHIFITILGAVFLWTCNAAPLNSNEVEAEQFVQQISEKLYNHYNKLSRDTFNIQDKDPATVLDEYYTIMQTANALIAIVNDSKAYDCTQFKDEQLKYIFQKIRRSAEEAAVGEKTYLTMITFLTALDELSTNRDIQAYRNNSVKLAYFPDIQNIFAENNDPEELKYYWTAWRRKTNMWAAYNFYIIGSSLKDAANMTEIPPLEFWLREYNVTEMEQVMTQIQPLYRQLHAFIRNQLHKKYGDSVIKSNGPIPDHLFQQVLAQSWTNGSVIDEMYPHKDLPPYDSILEKNNYDTLKLFKTADKFYQSLGFDPIPDDLWTSQIKMNKDEDKGDCRATIFDLTPNVYMRYCHKMNFRKFLQAHGYMGRLYYAREKTNLPAYYFSSHNLEYPVGEAVILSASTPKHLNAIEIVTDFEFTEEVRMNRLLRMGIHTLLNVPVYFVHTKVMADLFAETVEFTELNRHYWMLMEKYVGVEPPVDRASDSLDFPFKFYIDLNKNKQAIKFNSEILGYQFYKKLCEISGQYSQEPLQYCDFYGSKMVGSALKKMMKLGSSKSFREVLATLIPESTTVSAESLLEYYQPIMTWLSNKNVEANVKLGWIHSDKKFIESISQNE